MASRSLSNLRGLVIVIVVAFHAFSAYLGSISQTPSSFDVPPFLWQAFPIVDSRRWFGFDIFCAWQDVYLMSLMFFLSALFTWPSLNHKGARRFLQDRFQRLGVPFLFGVFVVMPIAVYPAYRVRALDPGVGAYLHHYLALPFWPNGPMWFLWQLLALTLLAAGLHRFAPHWIESLGRWSATARSRPGRYFLALGSAAALGYVPLALIFTPWMWANHGPFGLQFSRPLLYAVLYVAGLGVGAHGFERGLLAPDGLLPSRWSRWLAVASVLFVLWMGLTALGMRQAGGGTIALRALIAVSFALACTSGCLAALASCLWFGRSRSAVLETLSGNAFGIYILHYPFVVWLQYALVGIALFAVLKAAIVLAAALLLASAASAGIASIPFGSRVIGVERPRIGLPVSRSGTEGVGADTPDGSRGILRAASASEPRADCAMEDAVR
ncbi:MAG: acyltransferase [Alphaproteobacteria bacterium]|nr:acyltransferase [Alphaproteobacteria bacterium]